MELTAAQRAQYDEDGFLIFPELFSVDEVAVLRDEIVRISKVDADCIFREGESGAAKIMFAMHETGGPTASAPFRAASRTPRALHTAQQVLGEDALYLHHSKVNMKPAIEGSVWPWHQDFGTWHLDGIAEARLATMVVLLDDATEFSGCLYLLPGSHREGRKAAYWDESTSYKLWAVGPKAVRDMIARCPDPVPLTGKTGTAAVFHCNILHASGHNLSAADRWHAYFTYNTVANRPADVDNPRPDYVRSRNWTPMSVEPEDGILRAAAVDA
jgi:ectoine hydroxylase